MQVSAPPTATGLVSRWATTTRRTPAATSACAQGPVRPVWLQGSRVTTAVAPRARLAGPGQRVDLGVRAAGTAVEALGDGAPGGVEQDAADARVGSERYAGARRQLEGATHRRSLDVR